jgi:hypothetical protein
MILPSIAGNDSRCGIALRVFLGELSAISCQYQYPLSANFPYNNASSTGRCNTYRTN